MTELNESKSYVERQNASNQMSRCPGFDAWCGKGVSCCDKWKRESNDRANVKIAGIESQISSAQTDLENYQKEVIAVRDLENKRKIEEHLAEQAQLIEDRIAETFRVQTEEFMRATQANTISNLETDQTLVQSVSTSTDRGFVEQKTLQSPQGLQGSFFPIMMLGVMLS